MTHSPFNNLVSILVLATVLTLTSSCKKEEEEVGPPTSLATTLEIHPENQGHLFKPGTFWVYRNDSTNAIDTISVLDDRQVMYQSGENAQGYARYIKMHVVTIKGHYNNSGHNLIVSRNQVEFYNDSVLNLAFYDCDYWPNYHPYYYGGYPDSTYTLGGMSFPNTQYINNEWGIYADLYFQQGVGLVQWRGYAPCTGPGTTDHSWTLIDYHIVL